MMLGISSGGGACLRMLQLAGSNDATRREYFGERSPLPPSLPQPAGAPRWLLAIFLMFFVLFLARFSIWDGWKW